MFLGKVGVFEVLAGFDEDSAEDVVGVGGVVVGEDELFDAGFFGDLRRFEPGAMAPGGFRHVFLGRELGVVDEDVGAFGVFAQDLVEPGIAMFVIAGVNDDGTVGLEAKSCGALGMVEGEGMDREVLVAEGGFLELDEVALGGEEVEFDGEVGEGHLTFEDVFDFGGGAAGVEGDAVGWVIERREEGDALNVVPMEVGHQEVDGTGTRAKALHQVEAELARPGATIDHDGFVVGEAKLQASGVASVAEILRRRSGDGSPDSPEGQLQSRWFVHALWRFSDAGKASVKMSFR